MHLVIYDFAEHVGDALAFTPPTVPIQAPQSGSAGGAADFAGRPMYTRLKQSCMFRGDANSRWCPLLVPFLGIPEIAHLNTVPSIVMARMLHASCLTQH